MILTLLIIMQVLILIFLFLIWKYKNLGKKSLPKVKSGAVLVIKTVPKKEKFYLKWKLHNYIIFSVYLIVALVLIYIVGSTYLPKSFEEVNSGDYSIDLGNPTNSLKALFFSKDIFGENINDSILVESESIVDLVFKPKLILEKDREAEIFIGGKNFGTEVYLDDKLIIPDLSGYVKVGDFSDSEVWIKKSLVSPRDDSGEPKNNYVEGKNVEDFVYFNFPGASVYSFKELDRGIPILTDWAREETRIDTTFRDNLKLAVYHGGGNLDIEFTKQDLNGYVGRDEYNLSIIDFSTGKIVYNKICEDDGDKKDSGKLGGEDDYDFGVGLPRGIYYLEFKRDNNNKAADSTLMDIRIGSNKVLIVGNMLIYEANQEFFTRANSEKEIKFNYWWDGKEQRVYFTGDRKFSENIGKSYKSKDYVVNLSEGGYYFKIEKGFLWVKGDYFSVDEDSWFDLPTRGEKKLMSNNDVLIIGHDKFIVEGENIFVKIPIKIKGEESRFKFQVLDGDKFMIESLEVKV